MHIRSTAFANLEAIPRKHTSQGSDASPPLSWSDAPPGTQSFALVIEDPDAPDPAAPKRVWTHWVLYDIPSTTTSLAEAQGELPAGARQGQNDWGRAGYGGPSPPIGRHRYFHKLYALNRKLGDLHTPTRSALEKAMQGSILAQAELIGTYEKT